jgi:hypothetical protein
MKFRPIHFQNKLQHIFTHKARKILFSSSKDRPNQLVKHAPEELAEQFKNSYDPLRFLKANDPKFIEKLVEIEEEAKAEREPRDWKSYFKNLEFPILFILGSAFTFYLWSSVPFTVVFKQLTLSEYTLRKHYYHTLFTSAVSFKYREQFVVYFPLMVYACSVMAKQMRSKHFAVLFLANSLITSLVTILYEKYDNGLNRKMLMPVVNGSSTALALIGCLAGLIPSHSLLNIKAFPFAILPLAVAFYEFREWKDSDKKNISRPAHLVSIVNGLCAGLLFRRFANLMNLR